MPSNREDLNENAEIPAESAAADNGEFDPPPLPNDNLATSDFDAPPIPGYHPAAAEQRPPSTQDRQLAAIRELIEQRLGEAASSNLMSYAAASHVDSPGVLGVGLSDGAVPGEPGLVVYVESDASEEQVRREIVDVMGVRAAASDGVPVEIEVTGPVTALTTNRSRFRPAPAGASVGHFQITAGTIGGWARGSDKRRRRQLMVSNNHVLANSNSAKFGDTIIQPGSSDSGVNPGDRIAILERFVRINFDAGARNYVDCATAWCWPNLIRRDHVYHRGSASAKFFRVGNSVIEPTVGMIVGKSGRTTDLTRGAIQATNVSINVSFGSAGVAHFRDQFSVRSVNARDFSAGGDSGAFVWHWARGVSPVGLLFAGGGGTTFCNRLSRVLTALSISLNELS